MRQCAETVGVASDMSKLLNGNHNPTMYTHISSDRSLRECAHRKQSLSHSSHLKEKYREGRREAERKTQISHNAIVEQSLEGCLVQCPPT